MKRHLLLIILLTASCLCLKAQNHEVSVGLRAGHNVSYGGFAAISVETYQKLHENIKIEGGLQYNSIGRTSLDARPAYINDFSWGHLTAELLFAYSNTHSINNFTAGAGVGLSGRWISGKLGYYYRIYGGNGHKLTEPFNLYYELRANLLPMIDKWDLNFLVTNCEIFELERHYQPTFIAQSSYFPIQDIGISLGIGCKPAGMFHLSADYYQSFIKLGVCYRW